jgi:PadR family transcriptional regulator PadR
MDVPISAKAALLHALISGPGYGLELMDRVRDSTDGKLTLRDGSVYPALRALENEGLVESYDGEPLPERAGRPRRYYRITAEGAKVAHENSRIAAGVFQLVWRPA